MMGQAGSIESARLEWADAAREMLLDASVTYLNNAAMGPNPRSVFDRVTVLRRRLAEQPTDFQLRELPSLLWSSRECLASFVGAQPHRLIFTSNVSVAINLVASSVQLASPGEILLSDHEYETMTWCWQRAAQRLGLVIRHFAIPPLARDAGEVVDAVIRAVTPRTRLLFFSHVVSSTGVVLPAKELCEEARGRGIVSVVDGAQAPGLLDLDLTTIPCDFYAGSGHKWLLGPTGTGFLYLGSEGEPRIEPLVVSWGYLPSGALSHPHVRTSDGTGSRWRRFECEGTRDLCPWLVVPEVIDFQTKLRQSDVHARMRGLISRARECLSALGLVPAIPAHSALSSNGMLGFILPASVDSTLLGRALWDQFGIEVSVVKWSDAALLRVSTHFYNTEADLERLAHALEWLLAR